MTTTITAPLDLLVGSWQLTMATTSPDGVTTRADGLRATKTWFGDGRYVREEIEGQFGGERYKKMTLLGYNRTRDRFEYVTADNHDGVILYFVTAPSAAGDGYEITLFADYAMPDELKKDAAAFITIRTTLSIESRERHILRNAYRYPGGSEKPFLEYVYTRLENPVEASHQT